MEWKMVAALLAAYGLLKETRPSETFITSFLTGPDKNFTSEQVNQEIYPVSTYSMLALLVVIFLVTDWLRYKPIIVLQSVSAVATYSIIAWGQGVPLMQFMEVLYGLMWAADVAYFTYMYAKVDRAHYGTVSATARVGYLLGRFSSGVLSQLAVSLNFMSLLGLQFVTIGTAAVSTVFALALPTVSTSFYFHRKATTEPQAAEPKPSLAAVVRLLWADFRDAFRQRAVIKWSVWWALAVGGYMMVASYCQILWKDTLDGNKKEATMWNGAVEAVYTLLGAGAVWLTTRKTDYSAWGDALIGMWSLASGGIMILAAVSRSMAVQYAVHIVFGTTYHAAVTVASSEVAKRVREDAHALVFGFNTLGAYVLQTVLTVAVAGEGGLELNIREQFVVYGCYFLVIGAAFLAVALFGLLSRCRGTRKMDVPAV
ncbi:thiamine transporter 1-like [Thrips palmi]|uniref:Thiamine transporter 1-like n=1 Tax=Thrips palmi TaxID=161013 RepID=A0A6P8ZWR2_THRPL|nr:thiamine transporter 1-like [Thrips palmi]